MTFSSSCVVHINNECRRCMSGCHDNVLEVVLEAPRPKS